MSDTECYHAVVSVLRRKRGHPGSAIAQSCPGSARRRPHDLALEAADALLQAFPGSRVLVRMDAGFASGGTFDTFEELNIDFLARIRNNPVLNRMAEPHLERPGDLAADEVRTVFHEATYRGRANWSRARRVVLVVIHRHRELFPRHFWLITSLSRQAFDAEALLKRYRGPGQGGEHLRRTEDRPQPATVFLPLAPRATSGAVRSSARQSSLPRSGARRTKPFCC